MSGYLSPGLENLQTEWVDVDFDRKASDLGVETFGYLEPTEYEQQLARATIQRYAAVRPVYTRQQIIEHIKRMDAEGGWRYRRIVHKHNQGREGSCFPAGTLIRMADGTQKPIETIAVLDQVLTAEGNLKAVLKTQVRRANGLFRVKLRGHSVLTATDEHPILTKRGYVKIAELRVGDEVAIPRFAPQSADAYIQTADYIEIRQHIRHAVGTRNIGIPGRKTVAVTRVPVPDIVHLTPGFGRIIGLFLAEGSTSHQKVDWTLGEHEEHTLAAELMQLLRDELGAEPILRKRGHGSVVVTVFGCQWSKMFSGLCGNGARMKRLHPTLAGGTVEFLQAVFDGWMDGDGHKLKVGKTARVGRTISKQLALSMYDIANAVGMRPSLRFADPKPSHGVKHRHRVYNVSVGELASKHPGGYRCPQDEKAMWRPVASVEPVAFDGWVFNMEVEDDHSYVADGIGVHNCVYNATAHAFQNKWNVQFGDEAAVSVSPMSGYRWNARSASSGSYVGGAIKWLASTGLLPTNNDANKARFKHYHPDTGWSAPFMSGWKETAKLFRADEWYWVESEEEWWSSIVNGDDCVGGRDSHCIDHCGLGLDGTRILSLYVQSWSMPWGFPLETSVGKLTTFGADSEAKVRTMVSRDGWALGSVIRPSFLAQGL